MCNTIITSIQTNSSSTAHNKTTLLTKLMLLSNSILKVKTSNREEEMIEVSHCIKQYDKPPTAT